MKSRLALGAMIGAMILPLACKKLKNPSRMPSRANAVAEANAELKLDAGKKEMSCNWAKPPTTDATDARLNCEFGDKPGPGEQEEFIKWLVESPTGGVKVQHQVLADGQLQLGVDGPDKDSVFGAIVDLQLTVHKGDKSLLQISGREAVKAEPARQRVAAHCGTLFSLMLVDEYAMATFSETRHFQGCESLAARLQNQSFPDPSRGPMPNRAKSIRASCDRTYLILVIQQTEATATLRHQTLTSEICQDLALYINGQGL